MKGPKIMNKNIPIEAAILWEYERARLGGIEKRRVFSGALCFALSEYLSDNDALTKQLILFAMGLLNNEGKRILLDCIERRKQKGYL